MAEEKGRADTSFDWTIPAEEWSEVQLKQWARINITRNTIPELDWYPRQVAIWAQKVLYFSAENAKILIDKCVTGDTLSVIPNRERLISYGLPDGAADSLWARIEQLKKSIQSSDAEPEAQVQSNDIIVGLQQKIALLELNQAQIQYSFIKLSLQGRSSSVVADTAKTLGYHVDLDQCLQDLAKETSTAYVDLIPHAAWTEDDLLQRFIKHFTHKEAKLCFVDTHLSAPPGMTKKPDAILVHEDVKKYKSATSIICVVELKKENQLNAALGQVIKDMMELIDIQTKRMKFFGIYGNKTSVGFLKMVKNVDKATPFSFFQTPLMSWREASIYIWQLLATNPTQLGFQPPVFLKLGAHGMVTNSCHKMLKGTQVVVYKVVDPISGGADTQRCTVAPCHIENYYHSTTKRSEENPLVVVIKYSTSNNSHTEIATEIDSLSKFQAINAHVNIYKDEALLFPIPILLGYNTTPNEKYPYLLTYPLGKPLLLDKHNFAVVAKELNLALVLAHSKAKLFHGDVSPKNIVMHHNKPVLIDWAYSIQKGKILPGFTGTMTFASIAVTRLREQIQDYEYHARDDFESLFYTLLYLASGDHLPWSNKNYLSATALADAKRLAVTDKWSETKRGIAEHFRESDIIPMLDDMRKELFTEETADVESLFDDAITELNDRMATIK